MPTLVQEMEDLLKELPEDVNTALTNLIISELKSKNPARYQRAKKICEQANNLAQMYGMSVINEFKNMFVCDSNDMNVGYGQVPMDGGGVETQMQQVIRGYAGVNARINRNTIGGPAADEVDRHRDEMSNLREVARAMMHQTRHDIVGELMRLREIADEVGLDKNKLNDKIKAAAARIMEENDAVVHTDVLRGHPTGEAGNEAHEDARDAGNAGGEGSPQAPLAEGPEQGLAGEGPGAGELHGAEGSDRAHPEGAHPGAQTRQADDHSGPVQGRQNGGNVIKPLIPRRRIIDIRRPGEYATQVTSGGGATVSWDAEGPAEGGREAARNGVGAGHSEG